MSAFLTIITLTNCSYVHFKVDSLKKKGEWDYKKMLFLGHIRGSALGWSKRTERERFAEQMIIETHITNSSC